MNSWNKVLPEKSLHLLKKFLAFSVNPMSIMSIKNLPFAPYPESDAYSARSLLFEMDFIILFVPLRKILT
jgi:hypothetical protein